MKHLAILLPLALVACQKDEPRMVRVTFKAMCESCDVTTSAGGGHVEVRQEWSAIYEVGTEVYITAHPTRPASTGTGVAILVDGFQQGFHYTGSPLLVHQAFADSSDRLKDAELRLIVPDLDRFGQAH